MIHIEPAVTFTLLVLLKQQLVSVPLLKVRAPSAAITPPVSQRYYSFYLFSPHLPRSLIMLLTLCYGEVFFIHCVASEGH